MRSIASHALVAFSHCQLFDSPSNQSARRTAESWLTTSSLAGSVGLPITGVTLGDWNNGAEEGLDGVHVNPIDLDGEGSLHCIHRYDQLAIPFSRQENSLKAIQRAAADPNALPSLEKWMAGIR